MRSITAPFTQPGEQIRGSFENYYDRNHLLSYHASVVPPLSAPTYYNGSRWRDQDAEVYRKSHWDSGIYSYCDRMPSSCASGGVDVFSWPSGLAVTPVLPHDPDLQAGEASCVDDVVAGDAVFANASSYNYSKGAYSDRQNHWQYSQMGCDPHISSYCNPHAHSNFCPPYPPQCSCCLDGATHEHPRTQESSSKHFGPSSDLHHYASNHKQTNLTVASDRLCRPVVNAGQTSSAQQASAQYECKSSLSSAGTIKSNRSKTGASRESVKETEKLWKPSPTARACLKRRRQHEYAEERDGEAVRLNHQLLMSATVPISSMAAAASVEVHALSSTSAHQLMRSDTTGLSHHHAQKDHQMSRSIGNCGQDDQVKPRVHAATEYEQQAVESTHTPHPRSATRSNRLVIKLSRKGDRQPHADPNGLKCVVGGPGDDPCVKNGGVCDVSLAQSVSVGVGGSKSAAKAATTGTSHSYRYLASKGFVVDQVSHVSSRVGRAYQAKIDYFLGTSMNRQAILKERSLASSGLVWLPTPTPSAESRRPPCEIVRTERSIGLDLPGHLAASEVTIEALRPGRLIIARVTRKSQSVAVRRVLCTVLRITPAATADLIAQVGDNMIETGACGWTGTNPQAGKRAETGPRVSASCESEIDSSCHAQKRDIDTIITVYDGQKVCNSILLDYFLKAVQNLISLLRDCSMHCCHHHLNDSPTKWQCKIASYCLPSGITASLEASPSNVTKE